MLRPRGCHLKSEGVSSSSKMAEVQGVGLSSTVDSPPHSSHSWTFLNFSKCRGGPGTEDRTHHCHSHWEARGGVVTPYRKDIPMANASAETGPHTRRIHGPAFPLPVQALSTKLPEMMEVSLSGC